MGWGIKGISPLSSFSETFKLSTFAMAATRRLQKELGEIRNSSSKSFRDVQVDESNLLVWQGLLVPDKAPYNKVK